MIKVTKGFASDDEEMDKIIDENIIIIEMMENDIIENDIVLPETVERIEEILRERIANLDVGQN
jgi:hypothetical protein